jgi:hypothetical protein
LLPDIVTGVPGVPEVTLRLDIAGGGIIVGTTTFESEVEIPSTCNCPCNELVVLTEVLKPTQRRKVSDEVR